jgi:hypothetical protein
MQIMLGITSAMRSQICTNIFAKGVFVEDKMNGTTLKDKN